MNAVSYGLGAGPYFNLSAGDSDTWLDWLVGVFVTKSSWASSRCSSALLSLWRNLLLLGIGLLHLALWEGDILVGYALLSPIVIALRNRRPRTLLILGGVILLLSPVAAILLQASLPGDGSGLGGFWTAGVEVGPTAEWFIVADFLSRAVGMMLIGAALYRTGVITGNRSTAFHRRVARSGWRGWRPVTSPRRWHSWGRFRARSGPHRPCSATRP